jgi:hypothetical protein
LDFKFDNFDRPSVVWNDFSSWHTAISGSYTNRWIPGHKFATQLNIVIVGVVRLFFVKLDNLLALIRFMDVASLPLPGHLIKRISIFLAEKKSSKNHLQRI